MSNLCLNHQTFAQNFRRLPKASRQIRKVFFVKSLQTLPFQSSPTQVFTCTSAKITIQFYSHNEAFMKSGYPNKDFFVRLVRILEREFVFCSILGWSDNKKLFTIDVFSVRAWKLKVNLLLFYLARSYNSCSLNSELKTEKLHQAAE